MNADSPDNALELRSLVTSQGTLELSLHDVPVPSPTGNEVLVRIEASPINPSDLGVLIAGADMSAATVAGTPLPPETYTKAGDYTYVRDVPASALTTPPVKVAFALDRFLKAGEVEPRELGLVVSTVGLVGK